MGSGSNAEREIAPQNPRAGNEYVMELEPGLKTLFTLGIWERPWRRVAYPQHPGVGNFEADFFRERSERRPKRCVMQSTFMFLSPVSRSTPM
jgi:hypothetical protein